MPDDDSIERTKQQIRKLVVEIADLAQRNIDAPDFYAGFLLRVVSALAANGGAVWMLSDADTLELAYQLNLPKVLRGEHPNEAHRVLLHDTLVGGRDIIVEPHSGELDHVQPCNPTEFLLILGVLKVDGEPKRGVIRSGRILASGLAKVEGYPTGIVEIFQRPGAPSTTQRGYLKFLGQMCELANDYLRRSSRGH